MCLPMLPAMLLSVLGASGTYPAPGRPGSGYLVEWSGSRVWVDAGPGTFAALGSRADPGELDAVVVSHVHPDHCTDLFALYHYLAFGPGGRAPIAVYVPEGAAEHLGAFVRAGADDPWSKRFDFRTVGEGDQAAHGGLGLRFGATAHSVPTIGVRLEAGGRALAYSADTGLGGGVPGLAEGADVLLCEATYQGAREEHPFPYHLTATEAGELAARAGSRRLVLTHIPPDLDGEQSVAEAGAAFGAPVERAYPGMEVEV